MGRYLYLQPWTFYLRNLWMDTRFISCEWMYNFYSTSFWLCNQCILYHMISVGISFVLIQLLLIRWESLIFVNIMCFWWWDLQTFWMSYHKAPFDLLTVLKHIQANLKRFPISYKMSFIWPKFVSKSNF